MYQNTDAEEVEPWGPSSLRLGPDGTFLIVDPTKNRIIRYSASGIELPSISPPGVVGITDVTADAQNLYVLDGAAPEPALLRLSSEGTIIERRSISAALAEGLSGINLSANGSVLLEVNGGAAVRDLNNNFGFSRSLKGNGYSVRIPSLQDQAKDKQKAAVLLNNSQFAEISSQHLVVNLKVLGVTDSGDVFVLVDEIGSGAKVDVEQIVRQYSREGGLLRVARVPINDGITYVENNVALNEKGDTFALITKPGSAQVIKLTFQSGELQSALTDQAAPAAASAPPPCTQSRAQMLSTAASYRDNTVQLSLANLNGEGCDDRGKPRYLGSTAGEYSSVAYDWGGANSVKSYNDGMAANKAAGDISTKGIEECSLGVDCSGFVSRCWGFKEPDRYETSTLPNISFEVNVADLLQGDILNFPKKHVVMFDKALDGGIMDWESTTTNGVDRVVYRSSSWRRLNGYVARRFNRVC
jgi:hypothetical protein